MVLSLGSKQLHTTFYEIHVLGIPPHNFSTLNMTFDCAMFVILCVLNPTVCASAPFLLCNFFRRCIRDMLRHLQSLNFPFGCASIALLYAFNPIFCASTFP